MTKASPMLPEQTTEASSSVASSKNRGHTGDGLAVAAKLSTLPVSSAVDILRDYAPARLIMRNIRPATAVTGTVAGPARTVRYLPVRHDYPRSPNGPAGLQTVDNVEPGEVLVLAAMGFEGGAVFGDMMAWRAQHRGAAGVIADGAVRDIAGIAATGLSVLSKSAHPMSGMGDIMPWEADVPVECDGVLVLPGDWVLADSEATAVVPGSLLPHLVDRVDEVRQEDEFCCRLIEQGQSLKYVHPMATGLKPYFEQFCHDGRIPSKEEIQAACS